MKEDQISILKNATSATWLINNQEKADTLKEQVLIDQSKTYIHIYKIRW